MITAEALMLCLVLLSAVAGAGIVIGLIWRAQARSEKERLALRNFGPAPDFSHVPVVEPDDELGYQPNCSPDSSIRQPRIFPNAFGGEDHAYDDGIVVVFDGNGRFFQLVVGGHYVDEPVRPFGCQP